MNKLNQVILIGDSIRMGYQPVVERELAGQASVWAPEANGGHTVNILLHLHLWAKHRQPQIIHINAGLHDIRTDAYGSRETIVPIEHYAQNVDHILRYLRRHTKAQVIWATTTPVCDEAAHDTHAQWDDFDRYNADVLAFNSVARDVATSHGVPVNDLYAVAASDQAVWQGEDGVHFTPEGSEGLGLAVAESIRPFLNIQPICHDTI